MCSLRTVLWLNVGLFSLIAAIHVLRVFFQWEILFEGWSIDYWLNGLAFVLLGIMIYFNGTHLKKKQGEKREKSSTKKKR